MSMMIKILGRAILLPCNTKKDFLAWYFFEQKHTKLSGGNMGERDVDVIECAEVFDNLAVGVIEDDQ